MPGIGRKHSCEQGQFLHLCRKCKGRTESARHVLSIQQASGTGKFYGCALHPALGKQAGDIRQHQFLRHTDMGQDKDVPQILLRLKQASQMLLSII